MPRKLRRDLPEFSIRTVQEEGWGGLENGNLLRTAAGHFDVFLTADQRLRFQQNIAKIDIAVVVVRTFDTTLPGLRVLLPEIRRAIDTATAGTVVVVEDPESRRSGE